MFLISSACVAILIASKPVTIAETTSHVIGDHQPTPVEIWRGGDDGLTVKLLDAIKKKIVASRDFVLSTDSKPGTITIIIPSNVRWTETGARGEVSYTVELKQRLDRSRTEKNTGSCWEEEISVCADQIFNYIQVFAGRTR
jgi:hypothetical protein